MNVGSMAWRTAISALVMPTPSSEAKKPTPKSFTPLRTTAPLRCASEKAG